MSAPHNAPGTHPPTLLAAAPFHPDPHRWDGIVRGYGAAEVDRLRGSVRIEYTLARLGAERLWQLLQVRPYVHALGALTGGQAVQMVKAGLEAIYISGWQVAADANGAGQTYPDQSLYPADSVPDLVRRINRALQRADQIERAEGNVGRHWFAPLVADAEAGFGGPLNAFELMKAMIEAGAAAVHFEDQVASEKKCGHLGGKVLVPTSTFLRTLTAARLAADVMGVPTVLVARTDAHSAKLIMSDADPYDAPFIERDRGRTSEGFLHLRSGIATAIARGLAYAPHADVIWCETSTPDLAEAREFAEAIHRRYPGKLLAYNCSPSFNWKKNLDDATIAKFQRELGAMGYRFQFVTLAGFHALNHGMFQLASDYRDRGMSAYTELQQAEFAAERHGYTATRHQREVGTGYFDQVTEVVSGGSSSTRALQDSTEAAQFTAADRLAAAEKVIEEDHRLLDRLAARLRAAREPAESVAALEDLRVHLQGHFAREEGRDGLHGLVVARAPQFRAEFEAIAGEHRAILQLLAGTVARAGGGAGDALASLARLLRDHEERETASIRAALGRVAA